MESLANKYRPTCFAEIIGQDATVSILSRQVATKTFKNAYLLCGPAGLGKTSLARIMANEINHHESQPIEIDAASNNGVDSIRSLINEAQQASIDSDYKVFVVDECHSLTTQAWQAALKLIEEPPTHSIFIFCTTNPDKIPDTIMSRVQRFDLKKIPATDIADRLEFILNEELHNKYDRAALNRIAALADGHMREAIALLDKCISYGDVVIDNVEKVLGLVKYEWLFELLYEIVNKNTDGCIKLVSKLDNSFDNYTNVIDSMLKFFIECAKYKKTNDISYIAIPNEYVDKISDVDFSSLIDRTFKYRQLCSVDNSKSILDILILELSRG